jgi:hypothetical protein
VDKVKLSLRLINYEGVWVNGCIDPPFLKAYEIEGSKRSWLRYSATSRKVAGSIPESSQPHYDTASNRNEYQESSGGYRAAGT